MDCLVLPVSILRKRSRLSYRRLPDADFDPRVTVVVGREKKEFLVDRFILEESPFRDLMETVRKGNHEKRCSSSPVIVVESVDAILFEHMLWLLHNDSSCLFQLDVPDIIDFYTQD